MKVLKKQINIVINLRNDYIDLLNDVIENSLPLIVNLLIFGASS